MATEDRKNEADLRQSSFGRVLAWLAHSHGFNPQHCTNLARAYNSSTDEMEVRRPETQNQLSLQSELKAILEYVRLHLKPKQINTKELIKWDSNI